MIAVWLAVRGFLKLVPWQVWAIGGVLVALYFGYRMVDNAAYKRGQTELRQQIEAANEESMRRANEAARSLANCPPDKWNRETGKCEQ